MRPCFIFYAVHHVRGDAFAAPVRFYPDALDLNISIGILFEACAADRNAAAIRDQHVCNARGNVIRNKRFPVLFAADDAAVVFFGLEIKPVENLIVSVCPDIFDIHQQVITRCSFAMSL